VFVWQRVRMFVSIGLISNAFICFFRLLVWLCQSFIMYIVCFCCFVKWVMRLRTSFRLSKLRVVLFKVLRTTADYCWKAGVGTYGGGQLYLLLYILFVNSVVWLCVCVYICLFVCVFGYLFVCLFVCLFGSVFAC
jgi:hypothetical protein